MSTPESPQTDLGKSELMPLEEMANKLDDIQKTKNNGRGVSCVQSIVSMLRQGNLTEARQIAIWDHDKINDSGGEYRDVLRFVRDELFKGEKEHPWSALERMMGKSL